jgi:hypothetical protein
VTTAEQALAKAGTAYHANPTPTTLAALNKAAANVNLTPSEVRQTEASVGASAAAQRNLGTKGATKPVQVKNTTKMTR